MKLSAVTGIGRHLAVIQIRHVCANLIQEVAIVGDDNHRRITIVPEYLPANEWY